MTFIQMIILSIVEGITEFLPISSTGHLLLTSFILHVPSTDFVKTFEIVIQFGAILSVIFLYLQTILTKKYLWKTLIFAFLPAGALGFVLYKIIKGFLLQNIWITIAALSIGGIILILFEKIFPKKHTITLEQITPLQAICIGIGQSLAIIPGVSRSAASIVSGMLVGLSREEAVEFSFLLAVPTIGAASLLDLIKSPVSFHGNEIVLLIAGCIISFIVSLLTVKFLIKFVKNHSFTSFGIYRIVLAILFILSFAR